MLASPTTRQDSMRWSVLDSLVTLVGSFPNNLVFLITCDLKRVIGLDTCGNCLEQLDFL